MKKSKTIAIFCLLFIILAVFATFTSIGLNNNRKNKEIVLAAVVRPQDSGGDSPKYIISLGNIYLLTDVSSCENSTKTLVRVATGSGETKNVYACVYNDLNQNAITNCAASYIPTAAQAVYGLNNNNSAFARFCQNENINSGSQNNTTSTPNTGTNNNTNNNNSTNNNNNNTSEEDNSTTLGGGKDSGTTNLGDSHARLEYDNLCASEGFRTASKIAGIVILVAKWLAPLILIILGMIDFGKAFLSGDDKALGDATTTFIKRMIIAIIIPFIPGLLFSLINIFTGDMKDENGKSILDKNGDFQYCTDCLNDPLNDCPIELYDYDNQK